jgi:hypothetical protein
MAKYTIILACDDPGFRAELDQIDAWFATNANLLAAKSENEGCGCCVHIWRVECEPGLIQTLPSHIWSEDQSEFAAPGWRGWLRSLLGR